MSLIYLDDVSTLALASNKCNGCGRCVQVCPHGVFASNGKKPWINDINLCMECGACAKNCPTGAISVESGVGCASALISGWLSGSEPSCDCSEDGKKCC
ncbi:MAG: 4Fe-4S binding protein [Eubacteriaceae bacterium]|nr:4Fe-4S binding protein [Eubacteriaceae bacterium]